MPKVHFPKPAKRYKSRSWEIYWKWQNRRYVVYPGYTKEDDAPLVESELRQIAAILASPDPVFPDKYAGTAGVAAYMEERYGRTRTPNVVYDFDVLCSTYKSQAKLSFSPGWFSAVIGHLDNLRLTESYENITPALARKFLSSILGRGKKPGTHNRALSACTVFYDWLVHGKYLAENPFTGIKQLKEAEGEKDIVYCTRKERDRIIAMARGSEWPDWMAVPIAFYTGMRKAEIARMKWADILFVERRIIVPVTKTKERRALPMSEQLQMLLKEVPEEKRTGYVVEMPTGYDRVLRLENLHRKIRKLNQGIGRWKKDKDKNKTEAERDLTPIPDERIGWNAFRHTFGSLLAQSGVSLDKVSAWMGNTPEVCRRHYAQFVPRDRHDEDIEKL